MKTKSQREIFKINVLVNNAGFGTYGEFAKTDIMREMKMIDLDCTSLTGITGFAIPYMQKGSRIINVASLASFLPLGNFAVYGACKSYVLSFSVALAAELKHKGIKVTALCPGPVSTEFADVASRGARKKVRHGLSPENCTGRDKMFTQGETLFHEIFQMEIQGGGKQICRTIFWCLGNLQILQTS
ncbi:MAG: SDR family NAD(P)-dependent oxidoreductase [Treponema succinifaciens]|nr:MAG: SDR family NAD(P)-dependent oxidoreductase [Treponema succinifaciens]